MFLYAEVDSWPFMLHGFAKVSFLSETVVDKYHALLCPCESFCGALRCGGVLPHALQCIVARNALRKSGFQVEFCIPIPSYKTLPPSHQTQLSPAIIGFDGKGVRA